MKKILASALIIVSAIALSGCTPNMYDGLKSSCGEFKSGKEIERVTVSEDLSKMPTVKFQTPIDSAKPKLQTTVIVEGKGPKITGGQFVTWEYAVFSGTDISEITKTAFDGTNSAQQMIPAKGDLCTALAGVREGSRIALLVPSEVAGTSSTGVPAAQIWVFDIKKVFLPRAIGSVKPAENGMPTVVRDVNGKPAVTIPKGDEPTEFRKAVVIEGSGDVVKKDQSVIVHYSGFLWDGTLFDSSWDSDPTTFVVSTSNVIPGFMKTLEGAKVGSQIIAVIPPDLAYGATGQGSVPANATLVFIVDILGIVK
ncbi:MAG: FKBP-type peptidyl-prolyl cis-trans isomerase [Rhodoluna sp.]|nr:FKBP-type peptidyl-prolyl cis-trans isomerase [Rhodoluna sp.]